MNIVCFRASQRYINMLSDARTEFYNHFVRYLCYAESARPSIRCWELAGDYASINFNVRQISIRNVMQEEYHSKISGRLTAAGMFYLINQNHEYLVFSNQYIVLNFRTYAQDFTLYPNVEYYDY